MIQLFILKRRRLLYMFDDIEEDVSYANNTDADTSLAILMHLN